MTTPPNIAPGEAAADADADVSGAPPPPAPSAPPSATPSAALQGLFHRPPHLVVVLALVLVGLAAVLAHGAGVSNGYIWDDDHYVTDNATLRDLDGLRRIWLVPGAVPQYYPLVHTTFWLTYQLFELTPWPYHAVNILCHAATAVLLVLVLARLLVPTRVAAAAHWRQDGALHWRWFYTATLTGLFFAVHPVHVESVAWVTERKNVLSAVFYMLAALAWLRAIDWTSMLGYPAADTETDADASAPERGRGRTVAWHLLAFVLFAAALLSKTITCSLPAVLILVLWWRAGETGWTRRHTLACLSLVPWFAAGFVAAGFTAHLERAHVGAVGPEWAFSLADRCLIAGRALWSYLAKLAWPHPLAFFYTRWEIDDRAPVQYLYPLTFAALIVGLWLARRRIGRGPLVALLCFAGTLVPALGFFNVYPHRYSFVADHFNYLGSVPVFLLIAWLLAKPLEQSNLPSPQPALTRMARRSDVPVLMLGCGLVLLAFASFRQTRIYDSEETLWRDTIAKTPTAWIAHNNLGEYYRREGRIADAIPCFEGALAIKPDHVGAHNNLALCYMETGDDARALTHFRDALTIDPLQPTIVLNMGHVFAQRGDFARALVVYRQAATLAPHWLAPWTFIGQAELDRGNPAAAVDAFARALALAPHDAQVYASLVAARHAAARHAAATAPPEPPPVSPAP